MIAFVTLFLGLVYGPVLVELSAAPAVSHIELFVDGNFVAEVRSPWVTRIDLGPEIVPRELVAVARDGSGSQVGEARQWINRPRPGAEAGFVIERSARGPGRTARLHWRCLTGAQPVSLRVSFDGQPLEVTDPARIPLPSYSSGTTHILLAEIDFADGLSATAVASLGGEQQEEALRELTGLPIRLEAKARLPKGERLDGWFASAGRTLTTAAVEEGPAEVVFVVAGNAVNDLRALTSELRLPGARTLAGTIGFSKETGYRFVRTVPSTVEDSRETVRLFPMSRVVTAADGSFLRIAGALDLAEVYGARRLAEAVAVAGLSAAGLERRRAVVLLLGSGAVEEGSIDAARARRYLSRLRVPLFVWSIGREAEGPDSGLPAAGVPGDARPDWPEAVPVSDVFRFSEAVQALKKGLAAQRIVWVEGRLNPASIELTPAATGVALVR